MGRQKNILEIRIRQSGHLPKLIVKTPNAISERTDSILPLSTQPCFEKKCILITLFEPLLFMISASTSFLPDTAAHSFRQ